MSYVKLPDGISETTSFVTTDMKPPIEQPVRTGADNYEMTRYAVPPGAPGIPISGQLPSCSSAQAGPSGRGGTTATHSGSQPNANDENKWWIALWITVVCCCVNPIFSCFSLSALMCGRFRKYEKMGHFTAMARGFLLAGTLISILVGLCLGMTIGLAAAT